MLYNSYLNLFPVEILHIIFSYLWAHDILHSFSNINDYIDSVLFSYPYYQLDLKSIKKFHFDRLCRYIPPRQVISLTISDANDTPGQSELFLSHFQIEQFIRLRSLTLINIERESLKSIFFNLNQLKQLRSFSFDGNKKIKYPTRLEDYTNTEYWVNFLISRRYPEVLPLLNRLNITDGIVLKTISLPQLRYLTLTESTIDELLIIFSQTPQLNSLSVGLKGDMASLHCLRPLSKLNRLTLKIIDSTMSMDKMEQFIPNLSHLTHLELQGSGFSDLADGHRWQTLSHGLIIFNFNFEIRPQPISGIIDSFRTSFWLHQKRWYVAHDVPYLFSVPYFASTIAVSPGYLPVYVTTSDKTIFYNHINKLILPTISYQERSYLRRSERPNLELCPSWILLDKIDLKRIEYLSVASLNDLWSLKFYLPTMTNLREISFNDQLSNFDELIQGYRFEQIRILNVKLCSTNIPYIIDVLIYLFPCVEHLQMCSISSKENIIQCIDGFSCLSHASFTKIPEFIITEMCNLIQSESSIRQTQRLIPGTYTWRYNPTSHQRSCYDIHFWIGKQIPQSSLVAYWSPRCRCYYRFMHILTNHPLISTTVLSEILMEILDYPVQLRVQRLGRHIITFAIFVAICGLSLYIISTILLNNP